MTDPDPWLERIERELAERRQAARYKAALERVLKSTARVLEQSCTYNETYREACSASGLYVRARTK